MQAILMDGCDQTIFYILLEGLETMASSLRKSSGLDRPDALVSPSADT